MVTSSRAARGRRRCRTQHPTVGGRQAGETE
jgi:hypothetical protein